MDPAMIVTALLAGLLIGAVLGLVGGGGSILAVPMLIYGVGVDSPHAAIGTAAVAVALNAAVGMAGHARANNVKWPCGLVFAAAGVAGALLGAEAGKMVEGELLLGLFGLLMMAVGVAMLRRGAAPEDPGVRLTRSSAGRLLPRLVPAGFGVGLLAGFFGIGGGFLIVPALIVATGMPILYAVGSSLLAVTAFGLATAANYAMSGLVDWSLAALFIGGGVIGGLLGTRAAGVLADRKGALNTVFAALIFGVAIYMLVRNLGLT